MAIAILMYDLNAAMLRRLQGGLDWLATMSEWKRLCCWKIWSIIEQFLLADRLILTQFIALLTLIMALILVLSRRFTVLRDSI